MGQYKYVYRMTPNSVSTSPFGIKRLDQYYIYKMCREPNLDDIECER